GEGMRGKAGVQCSIGKKAKHRQSRIAVEDLNDFSIGLEEDRAIMLAGGEVEAAICGERLVGGAVGIEAEQSRRLQIIFIEIVEGIDEDFSIRRNDAVSGPCKGRCGLALHAPSVSK